MEIENVFDSKKRSLAKAISWRVFGSLLTMVLGFILTREVLFSVSIGVFEFFSKIIFFYLHERLWEKIRFLKRPDLI